MRELKIREIIVGLFIVFLFGSCINDGDNVPPTYSTFGFLEKVNDDYYINTDDDKKLKVTNASSFNFGDDGRVYAVFSEATNLLIELQSLIYVDYSDILMVDDVSRDTLGNGELGINYWVIYNNYFNVELLYDKTKGDHSFCLCYDDDNQVDGEVVKLELRNYSTNTTVESEVLGSRLSTFNLKKLISLTNFSEGDIEFELIINKGTENKNIVKFKYTPKLD